MKNLLFLLLTSFLCQSCFFLIAPIAKDQASKNLTLEKGAIPPDLGMDDTYVVALLEERESRDKYLRMHFEENYKGKYVFATRQELETKYADVNKYRYAFTFTRLVGSVYNTGDHSTTALPSSNYFIFDRKENKEYNSSFNSGMFGKVIQEYTKNMEKQRLANLKRSK